MMELKMPEIPRILCGLRILRITEALLSNLHFVSRVLDSDKTEEPRLAPEIPQPIEWTTPKDGQ